ncbi:hypothetical protein CGGC5_v011660 [Colletotrichum fructicola Nara gc5]|uniref:Uncharacterized protein n=1 Tax=Colletotrichum fructicola (strain Nara gc5) TaxID=1213859 RepID=A0A7J6ISU3_COLFN|nr:hypothetical protein CGGC5_v011660 [Colletotrichum fructicola Nara gc5]
MQSTRILPEYQPAGLLYPAVTLVHLPKGTDQDSAEKNLITSSGNLYSRATMVKATGMHAMSANHLH